MKTPSHPESSLAEEVALFRYGLIADVLRLEPGTRGIYDLLRQKAEREYDIPGSSRTRVAAETLRFWVKLHRKHGFAGLYPRPRSDRGKPRSLPPSVVDLLVSIKDEAPELTVKQVIAKARELGNLGDEHALPESTVHRLLDQAGLMDKPKNAGTPKDRRQFAFQWAGELMMSDVMHGPALVREGKRKHKTYLIAFLDDATRLIPHAEFCWSENTAAFFPVLKTALLRRGIPLRLYVDNGAAYRSRQLELVCAKLGVTLVHARPYQPQGKGKIERFFRTVRMQFLNQVHPETLDEMNRLLWAWVEGEYHVSPHRGIEGDTPLDRWGDVGGRVRTVEPHLDLDDLFLWEAKRLVRTDRTVSLNGNQYEVAADLVKQNVVLRYDPSAPPSRPLQVWHRGARRDDATPLDRHANCFIKRESSSSSLAFTRIKDGE